MRNLLEPIGNRSHSYFFLKSKHFMLHLNISNFSSLVFHILLSKDVIMYATSVSDEITGVTATLSPHPPLPRGCCPPEQGWLNVS